MSGAAEQLVVRQHERCACRMPAVLRIADEHARVVEFSRSVGDGNGSLPATMVDVSVGGTGVETGTFVPRGASVILTVRIAATESIEIPSRVQRVTMISREPRYYLGLSYSGTASDRGSTLGRLIEQAKLSPSDRERRG